MAAEVLRRRMDDEVDPEVERPLVDRCREGGVDDRLHAVAAPDLGEALEVDDAVVRVRRRLAEDEARRPPDSLLHPLVVAGGHRGDLDPVAAQHLVEELPRAAVRVVGHDDVGALGEHREERRGDGGHAAREEEAFLGALQGRELPLRHALGGVAVPAVLIPLDAALEVVRDLPAVPERVRRGLDDRRRQRAGELLARLAAVHRLGARDPARGRLGAAAAGGAGAGAGEGGGSGIPTLSRAGQIRPPSAASCPRAGGSRRARAGRRGRSRAADSHAWSGSPGISPRW